MFYFIGVWLFLLLTCFLVGSSLLKLFNFKDIEHSNNYFFLSSWLGLSILLLLVTTASLFIPLSPSFGIFAIAFTTAFCLLMPKIRGKVKPFISPLNIRQALLVLGIFIVCAVYTNQTIIWFDTGLYHLGLINWISQFGAVPGIALINYHFAKMSSWFALSAPLLFHLPQNRVGATTNGFLLLLACLQLFQTLRVLAFQKRIADLYAVLFLGACVVNLLFLQPLFTEWNMPIAISFSPDVPVNFFIGIIVWSILVVTENADSEAYNIRKKTGVRLLSIRLIPLILSSAAITIKVTAVPLVLVSALFYLLENPRQIQRWLITALVPLIFLLPWFAHGFITSGCPLSPSRFMCIDFPWGLPVETNSVELERVMGGGNSDVPSVIRWFKRIRGSLKLQIMAILLLLTVFSSIMLVWLKSRSLRKGTVLFILGVAWSGIIFLFKFSSIQILRFGFSYFLVLPCLLFSVWLVHQSQALRPLDIFTFFNPKRNFQAQGFIFGGFAALFVTYTLLFGYFPRFSWILPPPLPDAVSYRPDAASYRKSNPAKFLKEKELVIQETNGIVYTYPSVGNDHLCWSNVLVCAKPSDEVQLLNPSQGVTGGFIRGDRD